LHSRKNSLFSGPSEKLVHETGRPWATWFEAIRNEVARLTD